MFETRKLKDWPVEILDGDRSKRYPKKYEMVDEGILFLSTPSIVDGRIDANVSNYITEEKFSEIKKGRLIEKDIIMTTRGTIGKLAFFKSTESHKTGLINAQMLILRANPEVVNPRFLFYAMGSENYQKEMKNFSSGSAQPQIPITDLKETELSIPDLEVQDKVVKIIDAYTNLIENNNRRIAILEDMAQSLYREWFVKFRFPGHEGCQFKDSALGRIPAGWGVKKLKDITSKIGSGATPRGGKGAYKSEGTPLIRSMNIYDSQFTSKNLAFIDDDQAEKLKNVIVEPGDILLNITGASVARCAIVPTAFTPARVNQHVSIIRISGSFVCSSYVLYTLISQIVKTRLLNIAQGGATREAITKAHIENFEILIPPEEICERFSDMASSISREKELLFLKNENMKQQRDMLLPKLISGKLQF